MLCVASNALLGNSF